MKIGEDHWLDVAKRVPIPGGAPMKIRRFLVEHFTGGWSAESSIESMKKAGLSAHFVVDRDGTIFQCRPCNVTAGHAGVSQWRDPKTGILYTGLNACSIGVEIANCGDLEANRYPAYKMGTLAGRAIPRLVARHKNGGVERRWEEYPEAQIAAVEALSKACVVRYNLDDVVGHDDIAPKRKTDPGPAFPMIRIRKFCGFTKPLASL